jgi:predicted aconitase
MQEMHQRIGAIPTYTCCPLFLQELRCGEHISLTESNVVLSANSWYGARTNMDGQTTAIASAITGKTPEYGLHLTENRRGQVLIRIGDGLKPEEFDYADYGALGYFAGKVSGERIPVYHGLSTKTVSGQAKMMWHFAYGSAAMYHIVGVTPEAWTFKTAFQSKRPEETFVYGVKDRQEIFTELCTATDTKIDLVTVGCPHCTLQEVMDVAWLLQGRKVHPDVRLWVGTDVMTRLLAERMGLVSIIEEAGGLVMEDMCPAGDMLEPGVRATTSGTLASVSAQRGTKTNWFGTTKDCIEAAIRGRWESG